MTPVSLPEHIAHAITNRGLKLILNSTEQCNLRCSYCYESFSLKHMSKNVIDGILRLVEKRAAVGLDWLEIEFFGGEPLAAWRVVETLSGELQKICARNGIILLGAMTTNAVLLSRPRLDTLVQNDFRSFQITIDGHQEMHDARRITSAGHGTFETIWKRLQMLKECPHELDILVRVHFDASTVSKLTQPPSFFEALANTFFIGDRRFRLSFNPLEPWGRAAAATDIVFFSSPADRSAAIQILLECAKDAGIVPQQLPQYLADLPTGESGHTVCYAARANSFVIRSDGRVAKCTVALEDDKNTVGRILPNGELKIDHDRHLPWLRGLISGDINNLSCPAAGLVWQ